MLDVSVDTGQLSSRLLNKSEEYIDGSIKSFLRVSGGSLHYIGPNGYERLFPNDIISEISSIQNDLHKISRKLEQYSALLNSGPDEFADVDGRYKNELTNWWGRTSYHAGNLWGDFLSTPTVNRLINNWNDDDWWLWRYFSNDLEWNGAKFSHEFSHEDILGAGIAGGYAISNWYYESKIKNSINVKFDEDRIDANVQVKASGEVGLGKFEAETVNGDVGIGTEVKVGTISGEASSKLSLFSEGEFDPELDVGVKASAEGLSVDIDMTKGTEDFNAHGKLSGTLGKAEAKGEVQISDEGVVLSGEVGAAVFSGEVTGGITIFGVKIDLSLEGEAVAVGAEATYNMSKDSLEVGAKASAIFGAGFKLKISW